MITWTDTSDVPVGSSTHAFGKVAPGVAGTLVSQRLHNDLAGAGVDTLRDVQIVPLGRIGGAGEYEASGIDLLERRGIQVRQTFSASVAVTGPFVNIGTGLALRVDDLPAGTFHQFDVRPFLAAGANEVVTEWKLGVASIRFQTVANPAAVTPSIRRGIGEGRTNAILARSGSIGVAGIETLNVPDYAWIHAGIPHSELLSATIVDEDDGSAVTLAAGQSYAWRLVLDASAVTVVKGDLVTGAAVFADLPALPVGTRFLGWGVRDFVANLVFTTLDALPDFFNVTTSGLNFTAARAGLTAAAIVEGKLIDPTTSVGGPLTANETNTIQLLQDGTAAVTIDGSLAEPGAQFLDDVVTDGSGATAQTDRRKWAPGRPIVFDMGLVSNNQTAYWRNTLSRPVYVRPDMVSAQVSAAFDADTAGLLKFDLLVKQDGVAEDSMFPGGDDRRPGWDFGDPNETDFGLPTKLEIPPNAMLVCRAAMTLDVSTPEVVVSVETDEG